MRNGRKKQSSRDEKRGEKNRKEIKRRVLYALKVWTTTNYQSSVAVRKNSGKEKVKKKN